MINNSKQLSNPFSTGGGGGHFEAHVQASFVVLMLTGGYAPCLPCWPITEIKLQGKIEGYDTDDLVVIVEKYDTKETRKLLGQVKHSIHITQGDSVFSEVIQAAWNDFNNPTIFAKGRDNIALITGPLSATDTRSVKWLLSQARHTKSADEFYRNVEQTHFSPAKSSEKLEVFRCHLKLANNGVGVSDNDLFSFLNHFHMLGYDLGEEIGVVLPLLHSHISQFNPQYPQWVWSRVVDIVQTWNQDAGTITRERLPEDLRAVFRQPSFVNIPTELTLPPVPTPTNLLQHQYASDLALANIVGAWDENNNSDASVVSRLLTQGYLTWLAKAREILHLTDSPLSLQNGIWRIKDRATLWGLLGSQIFDQNLDTFKDSAVAVLTEHDPSFELPAGKRYAASRGKEIGHSPVIRAGIAEGLAILGSKPGELINCSEGKAETTAVLAVREIFADADWVLWGSLNDLLPLLAEAAPNEFLNIVEKTLGLSPCPFDELFAQEGNGISGRNYLTGLLWALEGLAWDRTLLVQVCVILAELATHDPGGQWANRPDNSLTTILLPWYPQTLAPIEKRIVVVQTLCKEFPEIAWKLIISLLPNQHQVSSGSHKPSWRQPIPVDRKEEVTHQEYWAQITSYADLAVSLASQDKGKVAELIDHFDSLPKSAFDRLIDILSSDAISGLPEDERRIFWDRLNRFTAMHRRFSGTEWALNDELLAPIEAVANKLAPSSPLNFYQPLFTDRDHDFYEEKGNWENQREKLGKRRNRAIEEILHQGGIESVIQFAEAVESPGKVGYSLGSVANSEIDVALLPAYLGPENRKLSSFVSSYIWNRQRTCGWAWADALDKKGWIPDEIGQFLSSLPFNAEAWDRAAKWLGSEQGEYWRRTGANPYQADSDLGVAVDKLIEYGRPYAAINCLYEMRLNEKPINVDRCMRALLAAVSSPEPPHAMDTYNNIVELIKTLQQTPDISPDELIRVEWAYLPLLDHIHEAAPKVLENRLATDPEFFSQMMRLIYRSKNTVHAVVELSENEKAVAANAWRLLDEWRTPPGMQGDGSFDDAHFSHWLQRVNEICGESGHLEVALIHIGKVLIYCPSDANGLWINYTAASALNAKDAQDMRTGFHTGMFNSRGVHWIDPTGAPERELAEQYKQKAEDLENAGYQRFSLTLRSLSETYAREAERIVAEHKRDDDWNHRRRLPQES